MALGQKRLWNSRALAGEPIVGLILDGTVVWVRLDRRPTSISLLVVLGARADGQKVLLTIRSMGGESAEAWRTVLMDLIKRGLKFLSLEEAGNPEVRKILYVIRGGASISIGPDCLS